MNLVAKLQAPVPEQGFCSLLYEVMRIAVGEQNTFMGRYKIHFCILQ
jgi:hypothetical protein